MTSTSATASINDLSNALRMIPAGEKAAYTQAVERAPRLVEIESNPERYLKFLDFDPVAAARRIVDYWSIRAQLFGPRAFLPLQLSGEGALSKEDLEVLKTGSFVLLPRTAKNTPVLLYDPARLTTVAVTDTAKRLRCLFYFLSTVSETDAALVSLSVYNIRTRMATFDPVFLSKSVSYFGVRQVIPVRIVEAHMIMIATGLGSVIPLTVREMERLDQSNPCKVVVYDQKPMEEIQAEMKTHGFTLEGLPRVPFGGLHCFGEFRRWIEDRIRKEGQVYYDSNPPPLEDPVEVAARRKRQIEAASARRKRARKKIQTSVLRSEVDRLTRQRDELCRKEAELQKKIEEARLVVRVFGNLREGDAAASPTASDRSHLRFLGSSELALAISTEGRSDPFCESLLAGMVAAASIESNNPERDGSPGRPRQRPKHAHAPALNLPPVNPLPLPLPQTQHPAPGAAAVTAASQLTLFQELFAVLNGTRRE